MAFTGNFTSTNVLPMDKAQMAAAVFDKRAQKYQARFMDFDQYNDTFDLFCDSITKENADILEVACGPGNITRYLLRKQPDFKILATDLAPTMVTLAKANNPKATCQLMDCRTIGNLDKQYDGIMCGFGLPYLSKDEAIQLITDAARLLNAGGILYLSTMEDDYNKSGLQTSSAGDQLYMHYHEAGYLQDALKENGFNIIDLQRRDFVNTDGTTAVDLIIIARR